MKFSSKAFNAHIENIGQNVLWMRAWACPCQNPTNGSPKPNCPLCVGRGRVWDKPVETTVGIASQSTQIKWAKMGLWEHGDMVVVVPESSHVWDNGGQFDRFITQEGLDGFSEIFVRGAPTEKLRIPIHRIMRCFWIDPANPKGIVEGALPLIGEDGRPSWPDGGEPPPGIQYSLTGDRYSEYFMLDSYPDDRSEHKGMRLPKRVVLRKWDLFNRTSRTSTYSSHF
ncbi:hypothetical protein D7B12_17875 [Salmonella enterica]|nr:hypothetical protein [Salmonella enterica]